MNRILCSAACAVVLCSVTDLRARTDSPAPEPAPLAVGAKIGTLGLAADATVRVVDTLNFRGGIQFLDLSLDGTFSDTEYDLDIDFQSFSLLLDYHPFRNNFRITGGALWNANEIGLSARLSESEEIGGTTYTPEQIGNLTGLLEFDDLAPYIGIGFGNAVAPAGRWSFSFDLGVVIQSYDLTLSADGPVNALPGFQRDLKEEEEDLEDDVNQLEVYPLLAFGVAYRF